MCSFETFNSFQGSIRTFSKHYTKCKTIYQLVTFKSLSYCFEETVGFDIKVSFARRPVSLLIKPGDITKEF